MSNIDKFVWLEGQADITQCVRCRHWVRQKECRAFDGPIPEAILSNEHDHRQPFPGDNGIQFAPIEADNG